MRLFQPRLLVAQPLSTISIGTGPEVMSCIDTPMLGGMTSSTVPTLGVIPAHDALVKPWELRRTLRRAPAAPAEVRLAASGAE